MVQVCAPPRRCCSRGGSLTGAWPMSSTCMAAAPRLCPAGPAQDPPVLAQLQVSAQQVQCGPAMRCQSCAVHAFRPGTAASSGSAGCSAVEQLAASNADARQAERCAQPEHCIVLPCAACTVCRAAAGHELLAFHVMLLAQQVQLSRQQSLQLEDGGVGWPGQRHLEQARLAGGLGRQLVQNRAGVPPAGCPLCSWQGSGLAAGCHLWGGPARGSSSRRACCLRSRPRMGRCPLCRGPQVRAWRICNPQLACTT